MTERLRAGKEIPLWTTADRVRKAREFAGFNQSELAERIGLARTSVARIEQGKVKARRANLIAISCATGVCLEWLEGATSDDGH